MCNYGKLMGDMLHEACGVFGIYNMDNLDVARMTYYALYALQHRGQESAGIAVSDGESVLIHKDLGLVPEVFNAMILNHLSDGKMAMGHVRYSTTGASKRENAQPLLTKYAKGTITLAHNGNLVNSGLLRKELEYNGAIFQGTSDTEVIAYIIARERLRSASAEEAVQSAMKYIRGAYSVVMMSPKKLIAFRDPTGFRPLCMGKVKNSYVFASETCALDCIGAQFVRDVEPGEIVVVDDDGPRSLWADKPGEGHLCVFEFVYFARPDSTIGGVSVHLARQQAGRFLAEQYPVDADLVIGAPDSGLDAALGYSRASGIPYAIGFIKNRYIGRTFIYPTQEMREIGVRLKLNPIKDVVRGKRLILVDDSIVRGTTCKQVVHSLKAAGATEVHMRVCSPPFTNPCYFGTDVDSKEKLIACNMTIPEICQEIGADTLDYLSLENLHKIAPGIKTAFCDGCFTGHYPLSINEEERDHFDKQGNFVG